ncbi:MAG: dTMP kinase [Trueperella sp.]|nr:dTMP kinase [Trueperella sp.]
METGLFLSFEGGDGSGKSTQAELLAQRLAARGYEVVLTREPGGTELGQEIRQLLLHGGHVAPRAEALLYAADRAQHVATKILPALQRGAVVITDRYLDSSLAYQGAARDLGAEQILELSEWATGGLLPRRTILLDVDAQTAAERVGPDRDRLEAAGASFHEAVRQEFLALAAAAPDRFLVLNAALPKSEIAAAILAAIEPLLPPLPAPDRP